MSTGGDRHRSGRWLAITASVVVAATVAVAVLVMDSPSAQRAAQLDARRVDDLERIVGAVDHYLQTHGALPPDLATLADQPGQRLSIVDPVAGTPYHYAVSGERSYRLCAVFVTDTARTATRRQWAGDDWDHAIGRQCFQRRADPEPGGD